MHSISALPLEVSGDTVREETALVRAARGDPAAFGALYDLYLGRIYAYLRARTYTEEDAADLAQQVFLQALKALPGYRGEDRLFVAWLFRIARNAATDFHRRNHGALTWDLLPEALQPLAADDLEAIALKHDDAARLRALFATLAPASREVVVLRFVAQLSVAEIAAVTGKSQSAIKKQLTRTMRTLKEQYHDDTA